MASEAQDIVVPHTPEEMKEFTRRLSRPSGLMDNVRFPILTGKVKSFDRSHGHGFIEAKDSPNNEDVFIHISDIDGEYVPTVGDIVQFRVLPIPPNNKKFQAVHVRIVEFSHIRHLKWNQRDPTELHPIDGTPSAGSRGRRPSNTMTPETGSLKRPDVESNSSSPGQPSTPVRGGSPPPIVTPPSSYATRFTRSASLCEKMPQKIFHGRISNFCREKGYGMIRMEAKDEEIFVHISDIEGEYIPLPGDKVRFCMCPIPPKMEKMQAVHVQIEEFCHEKHQKWVQPLHPSS